MSTHSVSRATVGLPGLVGALLLVAWLVGWTVFGLHEGAFHLLVPVGVFLIILQGVRRVNTDDDVDT